MAFAGLDDSTEAALSDGSWASALLVRTQRNASAVHTERAPGIGHPYPADALPRWCSIYPVAAGLYWIWCARPPSSITVQVRLDSVEVADIYLTATCADAGGRWDQPPSSLDDWSHAAVSAVASTVTLTAATRGRRGWIAVMVWLQCEYNPTPVETGDTRGTQAPGGLLIPGAPRDNPPEQAILAEPRTGTPAQRATPGVLGPLHQIGAWAEDFTGADDVAWLIPPWGWTGEGSAEDFAYSIYDVGVAVVEGVHLQAEPGAFRGPAEAAFYADEAVDELTHGGLARAIDDLISRRRPQWMCQAPRGTPATDWLIRAGAVGFERLASGATWRALAAAMVANAPDDRNGHRALLSLAVVDAATSGVLHGSTTIKLRIRALNLTTGAEIAVGATSTHGSPVLAPWTGRDQAIAQSLWGGIAYGQGWQWRGMVAGYPRGSRERGGLPGADWALLAHLDVEIAETGITYPCALVVEGQIAAPAFAPDAVVDAAVVGAAIASRGLDE